MSFFLETKQHTEATTIKNLRLETGWEFAVLLIKDTEYIQNQGFANKSNNPNQISKELDLKLD